ncbi:unnamed protein product [Rhizophagus irregularis]|nr:unnamed protein product [Rhizophagus irregularis]
MGFQSIETPKIHSAVPVRPFGWASEVWKNQVSIGCFEERENSKIRSGGLPCSEEQENSKDSIWWASEERKTKKPRFIRSGGLPKNENPKICLGGLLKNENPKIKICKCGRLPINKNSKIKIRKFQLQLDSIGCDILGLWICIGCDISLAGFGSVSTLNFY